MKRAELFAPKFTNGHLWDWAAAGLLFLCLLTAVRRLMATEWADDLNHVQTVALLGLAAGLALGYSRFSRQRAFWFGALYGLFTIPWQLGLTLGENIAWQERLYSLLGRIMISLTQLTTNRYVTDPLLFILLMALLFWILGASAGYNLTRSRSAWAAILPTGITILIFQLYDPLLPIRMLYLAIYLLFALLVVSRVQYLERRKIWVQNRTHTPMYAGVDMLRATAGATALLLAIAWVAPIFTSSFDPAQRAWQELTQPWQSVRDEFNRAFNSLQASVGGISDYFGDSLPLGRGNTLSDDIVLAVETPRRRSTNIRFYWRQRVYDTYDGSGWTSSLPEEVVFSPERSGVFIDETTGRWETQFTITTGIPLSLLYLAPQPINVSRPATFTLIYNPDGSTDVGAVRSEEPLLPGEIYSFTATVTDASILELRAAGSDYPDFITARYLQLPADITPRTIELAQQIAAGLDNPYDIAEAVTEYLRNNLSFAETVPVRPSGQEAVDWVLFDQQLAFCNYYATSEVVLLRILGIPARLAVGYAEGERSLAAEFIEQQGRSEGGERPEEAGEQLTSEKYTVRQRDVHAWPEVYFPGIGWVEFEPTQNQLPITRAVGDELASTEEQDTEEAALQETPEPEADTTEEDLASAAAAAAEEEAAPLIPPWIVLVLGTGLAALGLNAGYLQLVRRGMRPIPVMVESSMRRMNITPPRIVLSWARRSNLPPLEKAYQEINRALARLGEPATPSETPAERADQLVRLVPALATPIQTLRDEYQTGKYSQQNGNAEVAHQASRQIRTTSFFAALRKWFTRWQKPEERDDLTTAMKKIMAADAASNDYASIEEKLLEELPSENQPEE